MGGTKSMIVGPTQLNHLIEHHGLIVPSPKMPITTNSIDLRMGSVMRHKGCASLKMAHRNTGERLEMPVQRCNWVLSPNTYYLVRTVERVRMPNYLAATALGRSTFLRSGIIVTCGYIDPGYEGYIHFGITTPGPGRTEIETGFPALQLIFHFAELVEPYKGAYQGGNTSPLEEDQ